MKHCHASGFHFGVEPKMVPSGKWVVKLGTSSPLPNLFLAHLWRLCGFTSPFVMETLKVQEAGAFILPSTVVLVSQPVTLVFAMFL